MSLPIWENCSPQCRSFVSCLQEQYYQMCSGSVGSSIFNRNVLFHWAREISNRNFAEWKVPLNSGLPRTNPASHQGKTRGVGYSRYPDPIPKLNVVYFAGNGRHLLPSTKLTFSSQWISQDISLFLHEISLSLEISVHKSLSLFNF